MIKINKVYIKYKNGVEEYREVKDYLMRNLFKELKLGTKDSIVSYVSIQGCC